jgi:rubrerythrin
VAATPSTPRRTRQPAGPAEHRDGLGLELSGRSFRCTGCGYGVTLRRELLRCPMCGATAWKDAAGDGCPVR